MQRFLNDNIKYLRILRVSFLLSVEFDSIKTNDFIFFQLDVSYGKLDAGI